ncbi:MAG: 50S ribosomal protein L13e [Desulfurococcales archaeon]|nr:50S ribosomal protein L13e [Desulfurococcales archaeon]
MSGKISAVVKRPRLIKHRNVDQGVRTGKGFSKGELEAVGLTIKKALTLGIPVDKRRRSKHEENIETLRKFLEKHG